MSNIEPSIVIFDGVCNLCNKSVDFPIRRDKRRRFKYAANQSEAGRKILLEHKVPENEHETVFLLENGKLYMRSTAALRIARRLPFPYFLAWPWVLTPRFLRDPIYNWIAKNRYRWWGQRDTCRLPSPEERALFLK